jgi:hypothetical protein
MSFKTKSTFQSPIVQPYDFLSSSFSFKMRVAATATIEMELDQCVK